MNLADELSSWFGFYELGDPFDVLDPEQWRSEMESTQFPVIESAGFPELGSPDAGPELRINLFTADLELSGQVVKAVLSQGYEPGSGWWYTAWVSASPDEQRVDWMLTECEWSILVVDPSPAARWLKHRQGPVGAGRLSASWRRYLSVPERNEFLRVLLLFLWRQAQLVGLQRLTSELPVISSALPSGMRRSLASSNFPGWSTP